MAGITLDQAQAQLDAYLAASLAISRKQSYDIDTGSGGRRSLSYADLGEVREQIRFWQGEVVRLMREQSSGRRGIGLSRGMPL